MEVKKERKPIDWDKPIEWVSYKGEVSPARVICTDRKPQFPSDPHNYVVLIDRPADGEQYIGVRKDGTTRLSSGYIRNRLEKRKAWVNIYRDTTNSSVHRTREFADYFGYGRIACIEIEYTEGEGIDKSS